MQGYIPYAARLQNYLLLLQQFARLRSWLQSLEKEPYGHEFYEPKSLLVKSVNTTDNLPFRVSADKIDTSQWAYRWIPALPAKASTPRYGKVEMLLRPHITVTWCGSVVCVLKVVSD